MGKAKVTELKKVDVDFVSFVNEGANGMKFQIFKSKNVSDKAKVESSLPMETKPPCAGKPDAPNTVRPKKARYTMRELIENIVRGMFVDTRQPSVQPDAMLPQSASAPTGASAATDPPATTETAKETPPMNEIQQSIMAMRDDVIAAITGLRDAILAATAPSSPNGQSDPDVTFSKDGMPPAVAVDPNDRSGSQTPTNTSTVQPNPPEASKGAEATPVSSPAKADEIAALNGIVLALSKKVEALAGKIEVIAKERGASNAIPEGDSSSARREVRKNAAGKEIPDFSNIF